MLRRLPWFLVLLTGCAESDAVSSEADAKSPIVDAGPDARAELLDAFVAPPPDASARGDGAADAAIPKNNYDPRDPIEVIPALDPETLAPTTLPMGAKGDLVISATGNGCLSAASATDGAAVSVQVCRGNTGQRWTITDRVLSLADQPSLCLDNASGSFRLSRCAALTQDWTLADDGVIEKGSNAADLTGAGALITYGTHRGENQRWTLLSADLARLQGASAPTYPLAASNDAAYQLELVRHRVNAVQPPYPLYAPRDVSRFPGSVPADAAKVSHRVHLDRRFDHEQDYLLVSWPNQHWQSTGLYAPAGAAIAVVVPEGANVAGLFARLNVHTDRLSPTSGNVAGGQFQRMPIVALRFPLTTGVNLLRTPYGGEVVLESSERVEATLAIDIHGAIAMPRFVRGVTTKEAWLAQRALKAPWAELEGERAVIHVPSEQIRTLQDPDAVMARYDRVVALEAELSGLDASSGVHRMYDGKVRFVADIQISAGSGHSGYPIMAFNDWDFADQTKGGDEWGVWHELGHNHQQMCLWCSRFGVESTVNLFSLYVQRTLHDDSRIADQYDGVITGLEANTLTFASADVWQKLVFLVQPVLAFPTRGWDIYVQLMRAYRELPEAERKTVCGSEQAQTDTFYRLLSQACQADLRDHFARWGVTVSQSARDQVAARFSPPSVVVWRAREP